MATDKPKNVINVADLDDIAENPDPVRVPVGDSKTVTFPDLFDLPIEQAEEFFAEMYRGMDRAILTPALKKWLSKDDYDALLKAYPTFRKLNPIIRRVMDKYEASWGAEGEGDASTA